MSDDGDIWDLLRQRHVFELVRDAVFAYVALDTSYHLGSAIYHRGLLTTLSDCQRWVKLKLFQTFRRMPGVEDAIQRELDKVKADIEGRLVVRLPGLPAITALPEDGLSAEAVEELLAQYEQMDDADVEGGRVSGTVYSMDGRLRQIVRAAYARFMYSNPLHPEVFRGVRKMEAEVVAMTVAMFNGDEECVGTMTSGGTESILLACKAYRDRARAERGVLFPEIVVPVTAHAAFEKAAHYFGIRLVQAAVDGESGKANVVEMTRLVTPNTIALVGSAPCFSLGVIDDIEGIAGVALKHGIGCHVDCCLGSFLLPHLSDLNRASITPFDFGVAGVTSISCDPHKYGFAPKGSSVIMYSDSALRQHQYFVSTDWTGGIYATPTITGSRPGALVAGTWAAMMAMGQDGYRQAAAQIVLVVDRICDGVDCIEGLFVYGRPASSVVAFGSRTLNIYAVNDAMSRRGWHLNALQNPPAVHLACTMLTSERTVEDFLHDLTEAVEEVRADPEGAAAGGTATIYGTNATLPDKSIVASVARSYVDILYKL